MAKVNVKNFVLCMIPPGAVVVGIPIVRPTREGSSDGP